MPQNKYFEQDVHLIGFTGKMGSGKTEACNMLLAACRTQGIPAECVKFAAPIYQMMKGIYQIVGLPFDKNIARPLMQYIGTDFFRKTYGDDFWVHHWRKTVEKLVKETHPDHFPIVILCDDVRFPNEAEAIRQLGGHVIEVYTSADIRERRGVNISEGGHSSEAGIDPSLLTGVIINNSSKDVFRDKVNAILTAWAIKTKK